MPPSCWAGLLFMGMLFGAVTEGTEPGIKRPYYKTSCLSVHYAWQLLFGLCHKRAAYGKALTKVVLAKAFFPPKNLAINDWKIFISCLLLIIYIYIYINKQIHTAE